MLEILHPHRYCHQRLDISDDLNASAVAGPRGLDFYFGDVRFELCIVLFVIVAKYCLDFIKDPLLPKLNKPTLLTELREIDCHVARICKTVCESY